MKQLSILLTTLCLFIQLAHAQVDTIPEPDRMAEDFVRVSLCVADPTTLHDDLLGVFGHAFLRLQCPYYDLDYCFSYEGESVNDNVFRYLSGKTKMGMFAYSTDEYIEDYIVWNRTVREYTLNLPAEAKIRLWEIMDNHLTKGVTLKHDLNKYGCAITIVRYVKSALDEPSMIGYINGSEFETKTCREIAYSSLAGSPWVRLLLMILADYYYDRECSIDEKLFVPNDLARVWQDNAIINNHPLATESGYLIEGEEINDGTTLITPLLCSILLMLLSIAMSFTDSTIFDWTLMVLGTIIGLALLILSLLMANFSYCGYLLLLVFNPFVVVFWKWRKRWFFIYGILLLVGVIVLLCLPHKIMDPSILVLAIAYVVMYIKDDVKRFFKMIR